MITAQQDPLSTDKVPSRLGLSSLFQHVSPFHQFCQVRSDAFQSFDNDFCLAFLRIRTFHYVVPFL